MLQAQAMDATLPCGGAQRSVDIFVVLHLSQSLHATAFFTRQLHYSCVPCMPGAVLLLPCLKAVG